MTARGGLYLFLVWLVLIILAAVVRKLIGNVDEPASRDEEGGR